MQFKAKHTLDALKDADLPYFYSGFYCSSKHLTVSRKKGGVQSSSYFKLFLEYTNFQKIALHLVNPTSDSMTLNYHGQTQHIAPLSDSKRFTVKVLKHSLKAVKRLMQHTWP